MSGKRAKRLKKITPAVPGLRIKRIRRAVKAAWTAMPRPERARPELRQTVELGYMKTYSTPPVQVAVLRGLQHLFSKMPRRQLQALQAMTAKMRP
jgi:hypothetical protein